MYWMQRLSQSRSAEREIAWHTREIGSPIYSRDVSPWNECQLFEEPEIVDEEVVHEDEEGDRLKGLQDAE
jgi:hypothetical protein